MLNLPYLRFCSCIISVIPESFRNPTCGLVSTSYILRVIVLKLKMSTDRNSLSITRLIMESSFELRLSLANRFFFNQFIYLLTYFWLYWVFVAVCGLSLVAVSEGYSLLQCAGFSLQWLLLLRSMGSGHAGFSSCSTWAQ